MQRPTVAGSASSGIGGTRSPLTVRRTESTDPDQISRRTPTHGCTDTFVTEL